MAMTDDFVDIDMVHRDGNKFYLRADHDAEDLLQILGFADGFVDTGFYSPVEVDEAGPPDLHCTTEPQGMSMKRCFVP